MEGRDRREGLFGENHHFCLQCSEGEGGRQTSKHKVGRSSYPAKTQPYTMMQHLTKRM